MSKDLHSVAALSAVLLMSLGPVAAYADTSLGIYQTTDRKMDYDLSLCGSDGRALCVKLTAARGSADTARTREFIGRNIVDQAAPSGKNRWQGTITMQGYTAGGSLALDPGKSFVMSGCVYIVVCQDFTLIPAQ